MYPLFRAAITRGQLSLVNPAILQIAFRLSKHGVFARRNRRVIG
jgi:hypothetical protein